MQSGGEALWLLALLLGPVCMLLGIRYWRNALFAVLVLVVFEGALRKWVFPGGASAVYFAKDAMLLCVYVGFLLENDRVKSWVGNDGTALIKGLAVATLFFACFQMLNPNSPSILIGLFGLKAYFWYIPVAFVFPYAIKSREQLLRLIKWYLALAIPIAVLGFVQVGLGPGSALNTYVSHSEEGPQLAYFGAQMDIVRTSATFSYITGYATFLAFIALLAIGYSMGQGWRIKGNTIPLVALTLAVGAMFTTGSRSPVFALMITAPFILWFSLRAQLTSLRTAVRLCIILPLILLVALQLSPQATDAFMARAAEGDSSYTLMRAFPVDEKIFALFNAPLFGMGIGTTLSGAIGIMGDGSFWWLQGLLVEDEMARVTVELGAVGMVLLYGLRVLVVTFALRRISSFRDPAYRALAIVLVAYLSLALIFPIVTNVTAGLYYWTALGLFLSMQRLQRLSPYAAGPTVPERRTKMIPVGNLR